MKVKMRMIHINERRRASHLEPLAGHAVVDYAFPVLDHLAHLNTPKQNTAYTPETDGQPKTTESQDVWPRTGWDNRRGKNAYLLRSLRHSYRILTSRPAGRRLYESTYRVRLCVACGHHASPLPHHVVDRGQISNHYA